MPFTSLADIEAALENAAARQQPRVTKTSSVSSVAAGAQVSFWGVAGTPGAGSYMPVSPWVFDNTSVGAIPYDNPVGGLKTHIAKLAVSSTAVTAYELHDRLMAVRVDATVTTTQSFVGFDLLTQTNVSNLAQRIGRSDYSNVQWWIEWSGLPGSSSGITINYTDQSGTAQTMVVPVASGTAGSRCLPLIPPAGQFIRGITSAALPTSAGSNSAFNIVATLQRTEFFTTSAIGVQMFDWATLGFPVIYDSSCLFIMGVASTTAVQPPTVTLTLVQG